MEYAPQDAPEGASQNATDSGLSIRELEAQITELAGHLNAANHRWLVLIAEFDRRNGWSDGATQSCAHWLSWKCGLDLGAAREKVRVARAIESLPKISVAMSNGQLSYSKARALTRVATPAIEDVLLNVALNGTTHHVETLVRQFRRVQEVEELSREALQYSQRRLTYFHDHDGSLVVKLQLTAESGALFLKAIEAALPEIPLPDDCKDSLHVSAETSTAVIRATPMSMRRADALVVMAESFLQHGAAAMKGGDRHQVVRARRRCHAAQGRARSLRARRRPCGFGRNRASPLVRVQQGRDHARTSRASRSMSVAKPAASRRRCAVRSRRATKAAFFRAAITSATWTGTMSSTGRTAARPSSRIWLRCAGSTIARCTKAASGCSVATTARGVSPMPGANRCTDAHRDTRSRWRIGETCQPRTKRAA